MMPAGELWRSQESVSCPYSPKCLERLYENSGYVSNRYPTKRRKRPHRTVFRCFVLQKSHHQGFSNYFSYSLRRGILRSLNALECIPIRYRGVKSAVLVRSRQVPKPNILWPRINIQNSPCRECCPCPQ